MKTVFIDCSPKKKLSTSGLLNRITGFFVGGDKQRVKFRTRADNQKVLAAIKDADNVVFAMPLYVDGVPSHVLPLLKELESFSKEQKWDKRVYVIANNGFIEGKQNEPLMQIMENFCRRSNLSWCGGFGVGGGVMVNVMHILTMVFLVMMLLKVVFGTIQTGGSFWEEPVVDFLKQLLGILILECGIIIWDIGMAICINKGKAFGKHYTRIMLPSFVFILIADVFFFLSSLFCGGIFRGWCSKKRPDR